MSKVAVLAFAVTLIGMICILYAFLGPEIVQDFVAVSIDERPV